LSDKNSRDMGKMIVQKRRITMVRKVVFLSIVTLGSIAMVFSFSSNSDDQIKIRPAAVAGSFYPADASVLEQTIDTFLLQANIVKFPEQIAGLVVPHAGYVYSGHVAAHSYLQLKDRDIKRVVVISPSHILSFSGAAVYNGDGYETPLGIVYVDKDFAASLADKSSLLHLSDDGHGTIKNGRMEHALEVQLPFLQRVLDDFQLVPIVMGDQSYATCRALGISLANLISESDIPTIVIASSDLSHYHPYNEAKTLDKKVLTAVEEWDYFNLCRNLKGRLWEACGGGPMVATMITSENLGATNARILKYANSGDVPQGDKSHVVGYSSIAFYADLKSDSKIEYDFRLTKEEQQFLLDIARNAVESAVRDGKMFECSAGKFVALEIDRGAFVTLNKSGRLRGCIGYTSPVKPLYETVRDVAVSAALKDPRFPAVNTEELPYLNYEISVLSPFRKVKDINQIQIGKHGLLIKNGRSEGLLLPQVATDNNWDRETFLAQTSRKAGLPADSWKESSADIFLFSAFVFGHK